MVELSTLSITSASQRGKAEKLVNEAHGRLTYHGTEFWDTLYQNCLIPKAALLLDINLATCDEGQESYLGYIPSEDIFVSGWDTFETEVRGELLSPGPNLVYLRLILQPDGSYEAASATPSATASGLEFLVIILFHPIAYRYQTIHQPAPSR
jgi:hypothetical protein